MADIIAYCVNEKTKKPMKDAKEVTLSNGKHALQGVCASCGTKMTKFVSSKHSSNETDAVTEADETVKAS